MQLCRHIERQRVIAFVVGLWRLLRRLFLRVWPVFSLPWRKLFFRHAWPENKNNLANAVSNQNLTLTFLYENIRRQQTNQF